MQGFCSNGTEEFSEGGGSESQGANIPVTPGKALLGKPAVAPDEA
jgi:hypothetical protein